MAPPILSFAESASTSLIGPPPIPKFEVVPLESAYPGFGEFVLLPGTDHINVCKPASRGDAAYRKTLRFLKQVAPEGAPHRTGLAARGLGMASLGGMQVWGGGGPAAGGGAGGPAAANAPEPAGADEDDGDARPGHIPHLPPRVLDGRGPPGNHIPKRPGM